MPKSRIPTFIETLHSKLLPGSNVVMIDMLLNPELINMFFHIDEEGNVIHKRALPNGKECRVIKNFSTKKQLLDYHKNYAVNVNYYKDRGLLRWVLSYTVL